MRFRCDTHITLQWKSSSSWWRHQMETIHWSPVNSPHKGQWRGALMFSLICIWINGWVNNCEAGDLRHHRAYYNVIVMSTWDNMVMPYNTHGNHGSNLAYGSKLDEFSQRVTKGQAILLSLGNVSMYLCFRAILDTKMAHWDSWNPFSWKTGPRLYYTINIVPLVTS